MDHSFKLDIAVVMLFMMTACVPSETLQSGVDADSEQYAEVYIYRDKLGITGGIDMKTVVLIDDKKVALIDDREYVPVYLNPGKYKLSIRADENERKDSKEIMLANHDALYYEVLGNAKRMVTAMAIPFGDIVTSKAYLLKKRTKRDFEMIENTLTKVPNQNESDTK